MENIALKLAAISDAKNLQHCALDAFEEDTRKYGSYPPNIESIEWIESQINAGNFFLIIWQEQLVGGLCAELDSDELVEVKYVFVASSFQGKQFGSWVMSELEKHYLNAIGFKLLTPAKSYRNHHFYEKLGYVKIAESAPIPNDEFRVFEYVKKRNPINRQRG